MTVLPASPRSIPLRLVGRPAPERRRHGRRIGHLGEERQDFAQIGLPIGIIEEPPAAVEALGVIDMAP